MAKQQSSTSPPTGGLHLSGNVQTTDEVSNLIKLETSLLENKYFKWIISLGIAFLVLKTIDSAVDLSYIKGKQESYDKTINTLFESRDVLVKELKEDKLKLEKELLDKEKLQLENEKLKFEIEKLNSKPKK